MCGWGRTSTERGRPAGKSTGPMWSKNTNGPTMRRLAKGSTRPTSNPPRSRRRWLMTISIMVKPLNHAADPYRAVPPEPPRKHRLGGARDEDHGNHRPAARRARALSGQGGAVDGDERRGRSRERSNPSYA